MINGKDETGSGQIIDILALCIIWLNSVAETWTDDLEAKDEALSALGAMVFHLRTFRDLKEKRERAHGLSATNPMVC